MSTRHILDRVIATEAVACVALLAALFVGRVRLGVLASPGHGARSRLTRPVGFELNGLGNGGGLSFGRCAVIRYAGDRCKFCLSGLPLARSLQHEAEASGCEFVQLAPTRADALSSAPGAAAPLIYVSLDWAANDLNIFTEPTTLLVAPGGHLLWSHAGEITREDLAAASERIRPNL